MHAMMIAQVEFKELLIYYDTAFLIDIRTSDKQEQ
jgi:hypothetical protein